MSDDLISRLESAAEGSRELSDEVLVRHGWRRLSPSEEARQSLNYAPEGWWQAPGGGPLTWRRPDPTRSVDDALALVPEGWGYMIDHMDPDEPEAMVGPYRGIGDTPALALCAAILRALEADHGR